MRKLKMEMSETTGIRRNMIASVNLIRIEWNFIRLFLGWGAGSCIAYLSCEQMALTSASTISLRSLGNPIA